MKNEVIDFIDNLNDRLDDYIQKLQDIDISDLNYGEESKVSFIYDDIDKLKTRLYDVRKALKHEKVYKDIWMKSKGSIMDIITVEVLNEDSKCLLTSKGLFLKKDIDRIENVNPVVLKMIEEGRMHI